MSAFLLALLICGPGCAMALLILWWSLLDYGDWLEQEYGAAYRRHLCGELDDED